jgi:plasmid replication initiation protein
MQINNKDLIQSYILTAARYDYSVPEKRILYRIIELMQGYTQGKELNKKYSITKTIFDDVDIVMPVSAFLKDGEGNNHLEVKKALLSLNSKVIQVEDEKSWSAFNLIERPNIDKGKYTVSFRISPLIAHAFLDFSKGYSKYELETAMNFESIYAMRFYELLATQKKKITYSVEHLKAMFKIEDKYIGKNNDFIRFVVKKAKEELDKKSPNSFLYETKTLGKKIIGIHFYPLKIPENRDPVLEALQLKKDISLRWDLDLIIINYLKENFIFSEAEIKNNLDLFKQCQKELPDFLLSLSKMRVPASKKMNPKGYLINALKKMLVGEKPKKAVVKNPKTKVVNDVMGQILDLTNSLNNGK